MSPLPFFEQYSFEVICRTRCNRVAATDNSQHLSMAAVPCDAYENGNRRAKCEMLFEKLFKWLNRKGKIENCSKTWHERAEGVCPYAGTSHRALAQMRALTLARDAKFTNSVLKGCSFHAQSRCRSSRSADHPVGFAQCAQYMFALNGFERSGIRGRWQCRRSC